MNVRVDIGSGKILPKGSTPNGGESSPENMGVHLSIDETSLGNGEFYTIVTNKEARGREHSLVAIVLGTDSDEVLRALRQIDSGVRRKVTEVTLDLSDSMNRICRYAFPGAKRVIDRFHVQKQVLEAVQEVRIAHRWDAINADTEAREQVNLTGEKYEPARLANGDTLKELLARGRYALFKSPEKWTDSQRQRVDLMFSLYPDLKKPTGCHNISVQYSPTRSQWPTMPDSIWLVGTTVSPNQDSSHSTQSRQHFTNTPMK